MTQQTEYKRKAQMDQLEDIEKECNCGFEDLLAGSVVRESKEKTTILD